MLYFKLAPQNFEIPKNLVMNFTEDAQTLANGEMMANKEPAGIIIKMNDELIFVPDTPSQAITPTITLVLDDAHYLKYLELSPLEPIPGNMLIDQIEKNRKMRKLMKGFDSMEAVLKQSEGGENGRD